jgi:hypothetical protein
LRSRIHCTSVSARIAAAISPRERTDTSDFNHALPSLSYAAHTTGKENAASPQASTLGVSSAQNKIVANARNQSQLSIPLLIRCSWAFCI